MTDPRMPNLFIVGAMKSATTSLASVLGTHPDIFMSSCKEPNYFAQNHDSEVPHYELLRPTVLGKNQLRPEGWSEYAELPAYLGLFEGQEGAKYRMDASPIYLSCKSSAQSIKAHSPDAKILISLRNPYDRAYSSYTYMASKNIEPSPTFEGAVEHELGGARDNWTSVLRHVHSSCYADQVQRFLDVFGRDNVLLLTFEKVSVSPQETLADVFQFLGCEQSELAIPVKNRTTVHKNPLLKFFRVTLDYTPARRWLRVRLPRHLVDQIKSVVNSMLAFLDQFGSSAEPMSKRAAELLTPCFDKELTRLERILNDDLSVWRAPSRRRG